MRSVVAVTLVCAACSGPPAGRLDTVATGLALAQAPAIARAGGARDASEGCELGSLDVLIDTPSHYLALPPIRSDEGFYRLTQVVRVGGGACEVVTVFPEDAQPPGTGGGANLPMRPDLSYDVGLAFDLVEAGSELWMFGNTSFGFWRIDPSSGALTHDDGLPGIPVGAASDGSGGAWVTTTPEFRSSGSVRSAARLWHLGPDGVPDGEPLTLPFEAITYGLAADIDDDGDYVSRFVFHPVAVSPSGEAWVLDPAHGGLYEVATGATIDVGRVHATGMVWFAGGLVISSGLDVDYSGVDDEGEPSPLVLQAPSLDYVATGTGSVSPMAPIPAGPASWWGIGGFGGSTPVSQGEVMYNVWFPMAVVDEALIVADPAFGRVFTFVPID